MLFSGVNIDVNTVALKVSVLTIEAREVTSEDNIVMVANGNYGI